MSTQYTPGPWVVCIQDGEDDAYTVFAESQLTNGRIADGKWDDAVASAGLNHKNCEANARLIAAAPELLTALQKIIKCSKKSGYIFADSSEFCAASVAIAKATAGNCEDAE